MSVERLKEWVERLGALAEQSLAETPATRRQVDPAAACAWIAGFSDELGHRRPVDAAVLSRLMGCPPPPIEHESPDTRLWWSLADPDARLDIEPRGPITPVRVDQGVELWTETELGALHAVWNAAIDRCDAGLRSRCLDATEWHVRELQPDNATTHAWALHGFVICGYERGLAEAWIHAEMLLHACMLGTGRPDRFSACLMLDAARTLKRDLSGR